MPNTNCRAVNRYKEEYDVLIMRGTKWGNPFFLDDTKDDEKRAACLKRYKRHLAMQIKTGSITKEDLLGLVGKRLGCCCAPKPCHGDVIAEVVNKLAVKYGLM